MCGIAGVIATDSSSGRTAAAAEMIAALAHRGPNGVRQENFEAAVLAHARLSIIDLDGGWQPLHAAGSVIVANGEIYNYLELADAFDLKDRLSTGSDFEPLLHLYALEGERAFTRLRGMYAFCLLGVDGRNWLVRDRFGIKPLYTAEGPDGLMFASEPHALWTALGSPPRPSLSRRRELLSLNYCLDDGPDGGGVSRLDPGGVRELTGGAGSTRRLSWLEPRRASRSEPLSERAALAELDRVLEDSIRVHQRSDVPYGLFLSGGVDSTAIAVLMARLAERPVCAFTCGFEGEAVADERRSAERVAAALGLDWRETLFTEEDFWRLAPVAAAVLDDPTSDYACLPTLKLAEAAKGSLTVVLSGEGGDELFGGYGRYRRALRPAWLGGRPAEPQIATPLMTGDPAEEALAAWRRTARRVAPEEPLTRLQAAQAADIATWLPRDLLLKLDRCLMAHGLEGRTPFLDPEVARFAFRLPDRMKVRGRYGKWLVRRWLETACPAFDPWGRKKGFTVPVAQWIAPRAGQLAPRIASCPGLSPLYEPGAVEAIFTEEAHQAARWPLMFFCLWWDCHVEGLKPHEAGARLLGA